MQFRAFVLLLCSLLAPYNLAHAGPTPFNVTPIMDLFKYLPASCGTYLEAPYFVIPTPFAVLDPLLDHFAFDMVGQTDLANEVLRNQFLNKYKEYDSTFSEEPSVKYELGRLKRLIQRGLMLESEQSEALQIIQELLTGLTQQRWIIRAEDLFALIDHAHEIGFNEPILEQYIQTVIFFHAVRLEIPHLVEFEDVEHSMKELFTLSTDPILKIPTLRALARATTWLVPLRLKGEIDLPEYQRRRLFDLFDLTFSTHLHREAQDVYEHDFESSLADEWSDTADVNDWAQFMIQNVISASRGKKAVVPHPYTKELLETLSEMERVIYLSSIYRLIEYIDSIKLTPSFNFDQRISLMEIAQSLEELAHLPNLSREITVNSMLIKFMDKLYMDTSSPLHKVIMSRTDMPSFMIESENKEVAQALMFQRARSSMYHPNARLAHGYFKAIYKLNRIIPGL